MLEQHVDSIRKGNAVIEDWKCSSSKSAKIGDRAYIIKQGEGHRGIFASGILISNPFKGRDYNDVNKIAPKVYIQIDAIVDPTLSENILLLDVLKKEISNEQDWSPRASGISIRSNVVDILEQRWSDFLKQNHGIDYVSTQVNYVKPVYREGNAITQLQTRYERDLGARKECLNYYRYSCTVCSFNFEEKYGSIGRDFIHVHHLLEISTIKEEYIVDPIKDLRPVCPNCHAMLHKKRPAYTIDELKDIIQQNKIN